MQRHNIVVAGWDQINEGWVIECSCGFCTESSIYMMVVGEEFDDHMRATGMLQE